MTLAFATADFVDLDLNSPLDVQPYLEMARNGGLVKGMFLARITQLARDQGGVQLGREHYARFKGYPMVEWVELLAQCAQAAYPDLPLRRALFHTGEHIYRTFADSTIGGVVMSIAGDSFRDALRLVTRAYRAVESDTRVTVVVDEERRAVVRMRGIVEFPDCYHAGILSGGSRAYGVTPRIRALREDLKSCDLELTW